MTSNIVSMLGRAIATGAGLLTATHLPVAAATGGGVFLALIVWLALTSAHAKTKTRRDAARATLALILNFLRRHNTRQNP
ncbi:hypothetical protein [Fodinicola feengrottensis]|uniref:Uncharacterized protein n=1 Tax=Fodinicola feengrottensis TaxID=435914 RepID=A0ABN2FRI0_9ACTN|nr:hypothetical protein [Fodinicola feengrottensis]